MHVPGMIEAVSFDRGGEGRAYHDTDPGNNGGSGACRPFEDVDTLPSLDGGQHVGWMFPGEWLQYTVDVDRSANYSVHARVASQTGGAFHIDVDGVDVTGTLAVNTGDWDTFQSVSRIPVRLDAGPRVIRMVVETGAFNFKHLNIRDIAARGSRILGMDAANDAESAPPMDAFSRAQAAGVEATSLSLNWDQIEPAPGSYVDPFGLLATVNWFYPARNCRVSLTIRPIDANSRPVPADLRDVAFDAPAMVDRFNRMMTWLLERLPDVTFTSIQIGNEIDHYADLDVPAYAAFLVGARRHIRTLRPDVRVGYTATWTGLVQNPMKQMLLWLEPYVDVVGVTYYPLGENLQVRHPLVVEGDFDALMTSYPATTVFFQEVGYPSSALNGSSEIQQNDFVQDVFAAWDRYRHQIGYLSFVRVQDWSRAQADSVASAPPYYLPYPEFSEYLRTLGMRTHAGTGRDKLTMATLIRESAARGWLQGGVAINPAASDRRTSAVGAGHGIR